MEPGEALSTAAQIAVALAGFAGVVVAFRSKYEWSPREQFRLWLLLGNALVPLFDCLFGMLLLAISPTPLSTWHWVQRVLARFEFSFWSFELATPIKTRADGNQEHGSLSPSFLYGRHPGHSDGSVAVLQCSGLGRFLALLCRHHFSAGHRHFAICDNDSSTAAPERDVERAKAVVGPHFLHFCCRIVEGLRRAFERPTRSNAENGSKVKRL
jgi:hypothetical protein